MGVGTIVMALSLGPAVQLAFSLGGFDSKNTEQLSFTRLASILRGHGDF